MIEDFNTAIALSYADAYTAREYLMREARFLEGLESGEISSFPMPKIKTWNNLESLPPTATYRDVPEDKITTCIVTRENGTEWCLTFQNATNEEPYIVKSRDLSGAERGNEKLTLYFWRYVGFIGFQYRQRGMNIYPQLGPTHAFENQFNL